MLYQSNRKAHDEAWDKAIEQGLNWTAGEAVELAKPNTPVVTGTAQGSITFAPAIKVNNQYWLVVFGSFNVDYFIWLEIGTKKRKGLHILRRASDIAFPHLHDNIKKAHAGG